MKVKQPVSIYAIFHLNLAFSSIDTEQHLEVINRCYWPLLDIIEQERIPLGIELTAYTLETIHQLAPEWVTKLAALAAQNRCEIIASGDTQLIGPLVPVEVNQHNLRLGQLAYQRLLNVKPSIAYINEQAVSSGLLDCYIDQGFEAVVVEWDNPFSHNSQWDEHYLEQPQSLLTAQNRTIKVIWNNAITFQKFQRYAHDEITCGDFCGYLERLCSQDNKALAIYGNDTEIFDFRPNRYKTEADFNSDEWNRIHQLFSRLTDNRLFDWKLPREILQHWQSDKALTLTNANYPITVKKQAKYNVTRWGLSGRNDLLLNSLCYKQYAQLKNRNKATDQQWQQLCRLWASDSRTHLTPRRYEQVKKHFKLDQYKVNKGFTLPDSGAIDPDLFRINIDEERLRLTISTADLVLTLNAKKGLAIESLAFRQHDFIPFIGTLPHGYFNHINYGADYYSNHLVMERYRHRDRITDLAKVDWTINQQDMSLFISSKIQTDEGVITKWYEIKNESLRTGVDFSNKIRPEASIRLAFVTLLDCEHRCSYAAHNGGDTLEYYNAIENFDHGSPVSSLVSANCALGATEGTMIFGNTDKAVELNWKPEQCAALPMLSSQKINHLYLNRLWFSLVEQDDTLKAEGQQLDFSYTISPLSNNPFKVRQ